MSALLPHIKANRALAAEFECEAMRGGDFASFLTHMARSHSNAADRLEQQMLDEAKEVRSGVVVTGTEPR